MRRLQINEKQNSNDEWIVTGSDGDVQMKITFAIVRDEINHDI